MIKDYYAILHLTATATPKEIKKAYRSLALQYHPDKTHDSEERFIEITEAYTVLSDENKRTIYDMYGHEGIKRRYSFTELFKSTDFSDLYEGIDVGVSFEDLHRRFFGSCKKPL